MRNDQPDPETDHAFELLALVVAILLAYASYTVGAEVLTWW